MDKKQIADYLYSIFNKKRNGVKGKEIDEMILKSIGMIADVNNITLETINKKIEVAIDIEKEHTKSDIQFQKIIALQHLNEDVDYYEDPKPKNWAKKEIKKEKGDKE